MYSPDEPLFQSSDTGAKVFMLDGDPQYLHFVSGENSYKINLPDALEIFRLLNSIWYGGLWRQLNICIAAFCGNTPKGCHYRLESCPTLTEYEGKMFDEYNSRMRNVHMEQKRAPIAPNGASDSTQE